MLAAAQRRLGGGCPSRAAGSCCVRQCSVPRPQTRSTAWMPTTSRSGNSSARMPSAPRSRGIVERRHQHEAVGDVEVGVAGRQPLAVEDDRRRHRQRHHLERAAVAASRARCEPLAVLVRAARSSRRAGRPPRTARRRPGATKRASRRRGRACRRRRCRGRARSRAATRGSRRALARGRRGRGPGCAPGRRRAGTPRS